MTKKMPFVKAVVLLLIMAITFQAQAQNGMIVQGSVMNDKGERLSSATISVKNEGAVTVADSAGYFSIKVKDRNSVLVAEHIGYKSYEQKIGEDRNPTIVLTPVAGDLDNVVVIGYGTTTRKSVSTSISSVTAKDIAEKPVTNALQAVQGKMAGVNIQQGSGAPGDDPQVKIRGVGSIGAGNAPLYVVDGVPLDDANSFGQINPADIATIDVLKDAAAAAIYGSRAGNGVVLVTTKKGRSGDARFQVSSYVGMQEVSKYIKVLNKEQYIDYVKDAYNNAGRAYPAIFDYPDSMANVDWQREIFGKAPISNLEINASGGNDKTKYFVSGYILNQDGILKGTGFKRGGFRTNLELNLKPWLKMGVNLAPSYGITQVRPAQGAVNSATFSVNYANTSAANPSLGSPITLAIMMPPVLPVYLPNGDYATTNNWPGPGGMGLLFNGQHYNPVQTLDLYQDEHKSFKGIGSMYLQVEPVKGLVLKTNLGGEMRSDERAWTIPPTLAYASANAANLSTPIQTGLQSSLIKGNGYSWTWENTANYKVTLNGMHNLDFLLGYAAQKSHSEGIMIQNQAGTATTLFLYYPTNGTAVLGSRPVYNENTMISSFGRIQYNYDYRYLFSAAIRRDGSSRFGLQNRYGIFPSASAAWNIYEEDFFKNGRIKSIIRDLKIRASWGRTGNYSIGDFTRLGAMNIANYAFGTGTGTAVSGGFGRGSFDLATLGWETNEQFDLGLEFSLLKNRIVFATDFYNRISKDLLLNANVPAISGVTNSAYKNIGNVNNQGLEFTLNTRNLTGAFKWNSNFNISFNKNKITALVSTDPITSNITGNAGYTGTIRQVVGGSIGDFYGLKQIGIYSAEDMADPGVAKWTGGTTPSREGDIKYADINGDGKIDGTDITKIGTAQPKFTYGFSNNFSYHNFDLNIVLQGVYGGQIANALVRYSNTFVGGDNPFSYALDRWRSPDNPGNGWIPRAVAYSGNANPDPLAQFSTYNLFSASYLRINNVTMGYNFSNLLFQRDKQKTARLYFTVMNAYTFSSYPGYNPDVNMFGRNDDARFNVDMGTYPLARSYVFGLNIGF